MANVSCNPSMSQIVNIARIQNDLIRACVKFHEEAHPQPGPTNTLPGRGMLIVKMSTA